MYRLLYALSSKRSVRLQIVDGDLVEKKNLVRQNFIKADLGENKARVVAERYSTVFGMETEYQDSYIEDDAELELLLQPEKAHKRKGVQIEQEMVILLGCVDNNKSRAMCHRVFFKMPELIYIDSGNDEYCGQVVCGVRRRGRCIAKPIGSLYPEILEESDRFPSELSCAEAAVSAPQAITANIMAATTVVNMVYNILALGRMDVNEAMFSTTSIAIQPTYWMGKKKNQAA